MNTTYAWPRGRQGKKEYGNSVFLLPFLPLLLPLHPPQMVKLKRKQNQEPLALPGAEPPLLSLGRSPAGQLGQGQASSSVGLGTLKRRGHPDLEAGPLWPQFPSTLAGSSGRGQVSLIRREAAGLGGGKRPFFGPAHLHPSSNQGVREKHFGSGKLPMAVGSVFITTTLKGSNTRS